MKTCTVSKAASITKTFVAVLAMMLAEDGVFDLDDSLERWLPKQVLNEVTNARACTIRQLMNHTTGIPDLIDNDNFYLGVLNNPARKWEPEELIRYAYGVAPIFECGQSVSYSNTNYLLLAMVINIATGKNHASLLRERVSRLLNLDNTFYY
jgi:D-alanyl-D-alanine carboxypeptidase